MRGFVLTAIAVLAAASTWAQPMSAEQKEEVLKGIEDIVLHRAFVPGIDFSKWPDFLSKQKEPIDKAGTIPEFTTAVNRALREFGLSHINLRTPRAAVARTQTSTIGVGLSVRLDGDSLVVRSVAEQGPARDSGVEVGDRIISIDGKPATAPEQLEGEEGTKANIVVKKQGNAEMLLTIERKRYSTIRPETLTWQDEETAILRVFTFSTGYDRANVEKLVTEASKAKFLILDLRSNGGGAVNNLQHLLGLLLPSATDVGTFVSRRTFDAYVAETAKPAADVLALATWSQNKFTTRRSTVEPFKGKVAVLINRGSASASEICSAALRELGGAILVGTQTAGAVLASVYGRLPQGFQLQYPTSDYVTIKGTRLEKNPLKPDYEVTAREPEEAIKKAKEVLVGKGNALPRAA
jgi:carboxyl-terminal processing protease